MMIQVKTTSGICHNLYTFNMHYQNYSNCLIFCMSINDEKLWIFDYTNIIGAKSTLNIGRTSRSEYYDFMIKKENLIELMHQKYALYPKFMAEYIMKPKNIYQQQEQSFRKLRETNLPLIKFEYPEIEARVYDFKINEYKIQEKVASCTIKSNDRELHSVHLYRSNNIHKYKAYNQGDNDFYWIWLNDKKTFYIFPEKVLIDRKYIEVDKNREHKHISFSLVEWCNEFKYTLSDQDKIIKIFNHESL